ncbi:unnamed protein product [Cladocopium goreaui]|uniref:PDZ domain-containing protein n=1 Tax=Cladocopium goreaui TaxID=2562237 RepID=A0A9P1DCK7_9DINO|nr:unnamed protein product [Cladocopium goreaui]
MALPAMDAKEIIEHFNRLDNEEKVMVLGAVVCATVLVVYIARSLGSICGGLPSEEDALKQAMPVLSVHLSRFGNEKLGLCLRSEGSYATITGIGDGDLVDNWNQIQTYPEQQLRNGDRIIAVTSGGKTCRDGRLMAARLKENGDVTLTVAVSRTLEEVERCWQRMTGMVTLQDLVLEEAAELGPPEVSSAGPALDKVALEVLQVGPRLFEWNQNCLSKGLCCTQRLEVGDRVISIGGSTNVRKGLRLPSPTVTLVRWQPVGTSCCKNFEVQIERMGPEDRMGMVICPHPLALGPAIVLQIVPDGAVARWNASSYTPILPGDCIVSVNGMTAYSKLQKELTSTSLHLSLQRWELVGSMPTAPFPGPTNLIGGPQPKQWSASAVQPSPKEAAAPAQPRRPCLRQPLFWLLLGVLLLLPSVPSLALTPSEWWGEQKATLRMLVTIPSTLPIDSQGALALPLLVLGWLLLMFFMWCEVSMLNSRHKKTLVPQPVVAFLSSTCFGYGWLFLGNWAGVPS